MDEVARNVADAKRIRNVFIRIDVKESQTYKNLFKSIN